MNHPEAIRPQAHAEFNPEKMGKTTIFESERILVGLNAFQPGQAHHLHAHAGQDKVLQQNRETLGGASSGGESNGSRSKSC